MTVAHDAQTRWPVTDGTSTATGDQTTTHTPSGTPKGAIVTVFGSTNANPLTGVLYGGTAMTLVTSQGEATEPGWVGVYFLGDLTGLSGAQTVTFQGASANAKWAMVSTITAATSTTELEDVTVASSASGANPQVTMTLAHAALSYGGVHTGAAAPVTTVLTGCTHQEDQDYGAKAAMAMRRTSEDAAGSPVIGYTLAADDYAICAAAFREFAPPKTQPATLPHVPAESTWSGTGASKSTSVGGSDGSGTVAWESGDTVYVFGLTGQASSTTLGTPTHSGSNLPAFSAIGSAVGSGAQCWAHTWKAVATGSGSSVISETATSSTDEWGIIAWVVRGSDGTGTRATDASAAKTVSNARTENHSLIFYLMGDWSAGAAGVTWTPAEVNERQDSQETSYAVAAHDWTDQGNAGTTSYGISAGQSASGPFTKVAIEILGTVTTGPPNVPKQRMWQAVHRASFQ